MRSSERRAQFEKAFQYSATADLQKNIVEYIDLRLELLYEKLFNGACGEEAIVLRGEIAGMRKLKQILSQSNSFPKG